MAETFKGMTDAMNKLQRDSDKKIVAEAAKLGALDKAVSETMVKIRAMREERAKEMEERERALERSGELERRLQERTDECTERRIELAAKKVEVEHIKAELEVGHVLS